MPFNPLRHSLPLLIATTTTLGGLIPLWSPQAAMKEFGLPEHIIISPPAQACFTIYACRMTAFGIAMWTFYLQNKLKEVDTILSLMLFVSGVDSYVCWKEGAAGTAVFRAVAGIVVGGWGILGVTSG